MSGVEGKNCFRVKWSQAAVYSGGNIATVWIPKSPQAEGDEEEEGLVLACGDTLHVVRCSTGESIASFVCPTSDIILHMDATVVVAKMPPASADRVGEGREVEGGDSYVPPGAYIAISTRSLQIYVFSLKPRSSAGAVVRARPEDSGPLTPYVLETVHNWTAAVQAVSLVRLTGGGEYLLTGSTDGVVRSWNVFHHFLTHNLRCPSNSMISSLHVDDDEAAVAAGNSMLTLLAVGSFEGHVSLFDFVTKKLIVSKRPHASAVEAICFAYDKERAHMRSVVTIGRDRKICISTSTDLVELRCVVILEHVSCATFFSPSVLHVGSLDGIVASYHVSQSETIRNVCRLKKRASSNLEDADEEMQIRSLVVAGRPRSNASSSRLSETWIEDVAPQAVTLVDDSSSLAKKSSKKGKKTTGASPNVPPQPAPPAAAPPSEHSLYAADASFSILHLGADPIDSVSYRIVDSMTGSLDQVLDVKLLPSPSSSTATRSNDLEKKSGGSFSRFIVSNSKDVRYYQGDGRIATATLSGHTDIVLACSVLVDGQMLATGGKDHSVRFWDIRAASPLQWKCVAVGEGGHTNDVSALAFNMKPTDTFLVCFSVGADDCLRMWDVAHLKEASGASAQPQTIQHRAGVNSAHDGAVFCVSVSPNDQFVATGGKDHVVNVWRLQGKKIFKEAAMKGHKRAVTSVVFSPADRVLASSSNDGTIRLWSLVSFSVVKALQHDKIAVLHVEFFNKGTQLVTTNADGVLRVWATAASEVVAMLDIHEEKVWALAVREDEGSNGTYFVTGAADGVLTVTEDFTSEEAERIQAERRNTILGEQSLANALRSGEFSNAFILALSLNHPRHLRQVVAKWMAKDEDQCKSVLTTAIIPSLSTEQLKTLLEFTRDWIVNARHCVVATLVMQSVVDGFHFQQLGDMASFRPMLETMYAYLTRHADRVRHVTERSYYVDLLTVGYRSSGLTVRRNVAIPVAHDDDEQHAQLASDEASGWDTAHVSVPPTNPIEEQDVAKDDEARAETVPAAADSTPAGRPSKKRRKEQSSSKKTAV